MKLSVIVFLIFFAQSAVCHEVGLPDGSSFSLTSCNPDTHIAEFDGKMSISGRFVFYWEIFDYEPKYLSLSFFPKTKDLLMLPYVKGPTLKSKANEIYLNYTQEQARRLIGDDLYQKLLNKKLLRLDGNAVITINQFSTGIDCDQRWFVADIMSVNKVSDVGKASNLSVTSSC